MTTGQKSDLHPSTLTINDLNPGRKIIMFNVYWGEVGTFIVCGRPVVREDAYGDACLMVRLRDVRDGYTCYKRLTDMGVVRYQDGIFSQTIVTIDDRKRHLLPNLQPYAQTYPVPDYWDEEEGYGSETEFWVDYPRDGFGPWI